MLKLEDIVKTMESGDLSLEDSLKYFEQGVALTRQCQTALSKAEQKIALIKLYKH
jgi:exodeoxyribonuclease VII small subunit